MVSNRYRRRLPHEDRAGPSPFRVHPPIHRRKRQNRTTLGELRAHEARLPSHRYQIHRQKGLLQRIRIIRRNWLPKSDVQAFCQVSHTAAKKIHRDRKSCRADCEAAANYRIVCFSRHAGFPLPTLSERELTQIAPIPYPVMQETRFILIFAHI